MKFHALQSLEINSVQPQLLWRGIQREVTGLSLSIQVTVALIKSMHHAPLRLAESLPVHLGLMLQFYKGDFLS